MKIQLLSDLHLEFGAFTIEKADDCDVLVLAGDIGNPESNDYRVLVERASSLFQNVFIVRGNHECYGYSLQEADDKINDVVKCYDNVVFLNRTSHDLNDDVRFIGTTLWSDVCEYERFDIAVFIADFRQIKQWTIEHNNHEHFNDVRFIKNEIARANNDGKRLVVITHHAPYRRGTSRPEHNGSTLSSAFATDLSKHFEQPVCCWMYGHTHHSNMQVVNGVLLASNQRGYNNEPTNFNPLFTLDV